METEKPISVENTQNINTVTAVSIVVKKDAAKDGAYALRGKAQVADEQCFYISGPYTGVTKDELTWAFDTISNSLKAILTEKL
jgi:hypothetical protein